MVRVTEKNNKKTVTLTRGGCGELLVGFDEFLNKAVGF